MILVCIGTRPEYLKIRPLVNLFRENDIEFKTLFTGQHTDLLDDVSFDYRIDLQIEQQVSRLNGLFYEIVRKSDPIISSLNPRFVLVQGDTTTATATAIAASNLSVEIIHLEAGLRTYDFKNPFPEEANRQIISRLTSVHLCPTEDNKKNLLNEKVYGDIFVTGNTSLDNIRETKTINGNKVLITLHRRENHCKIEKWFKEIEELAKKFRDYEFILPIHPNPEIRKHSGILKTVKVIEPLPHKDIIDLLSKCAIIITDSGGIQEESSFLKKKSIICRKTTERPESLGQSGFLCDEPEKLPEKFKLILNSNVDGECPYGDGFSSERIVKIIKSYLSSRK